MLVHACDASVFFRNHSQGSGRLDYTSIHVERLDVSQDMSSSSVVAPRRNEATTFAPPRCGTRGSGRGSPGGRKQRQRLSDAAAKQQEGDDGCGREEEEGHRAFPRLVHGDRLVRETAVLDELLEERVLAGPMW